MTTITLPRSARDLGRLAGAAALAILVALLCIDLIRFAAMAASAIVYPYDLDYGEGIVWQQMSNIVAGQGYGPLGVFPAIVYHYPPVYHLTAAALAAIGGIDPVAAGRSVSFVSTLASMAMIGWLAAAARPDVAWRARWLGALVGGITFGVSPIVLAWATLMRVDMLSTALSLAGLCWTVREMRYPTRAPWGAIAFTLAVYTKQTAILAPAGAFIALWLVRPRSAWRLLAFSLVFGCAALVVLSTITNGGFLHHVVAYNVNRFDPSRWQLLLPLLFAQKMTLLAAGVAAFEMVRRLRSGRPEAGTQISSAANVEVLILVSLLVRIVGLALILKSGASDNYLIDFFSIAAVLVGMATIDVTEAIRTNVRWPRPVITLVILLGLPFEVATIKDVHPALHAPEFRALNDRLAARMRAEPKPIISDYMVLLRRGGHPVLWEAAITAELGAQGRYDQASFVRLVKAHRFGFILTQGDGAESPHTDRYNPAVDAAIRSAYPKVEHYGDLVLRSPPDIRRL